MKEIKDLRRRINEIDEQIIAILTARLETAEKIGLLKTKQNAAIYDPQREIQVLDKVKNLAQKKGYRIPRIFPVKIGRGASHRWYNG